MRYYRFSPLMLLPFLLANSNYYEWVNQYTAKAHYTASVLVNAALENDSRRFVSLLATDATYSTWNNKTEEYETEPLVIGDVQQLTKTCRLSNISTCDGESVQIDWDCGKDIPTYSTLKLDGLKVKDLVGDGGPTVCTIPRPAS